MSMQHVYAKLTAIVSLSAVLLACDQQSSTTGEVDFRVPVTVEEVELRTLEDRIVTSGTLRAAETVTLTVVNGGELEVGESASGRYREGDRVTKGDQIAQITGEDARIAERRDAALLRLETAEQSLEANRSLFEQGLVTITQFGQEQNNYEEAKLDYDRSLNTGDRNRIVTPIDGVILELARNENGQPMANGQIVQAGQTIAQVAPLDTLIADVDLVGSDIAKVQVGLKGRVLHHAWRDRVFGGRVLRLAPSVDERTRALRAEIAIDNTEGLLRPGMFVEVALITEVRADVPVIPRSAVAERGGNSVAFVLDGQRVRQQPIEIGLGDDQQVEVTSGLSAGDRVVVLGLETLTDQVPVRVTGM